MRPAATCVNCVYAIQFTQQFRWLGAVLTVSFPRAIPEPVNSNRRSEADGLRTRCSRCLGVTSTHCQLIFLNHLTYFYQNFYELFVTGGHSNLRFVPCN